MSAGEAGGRPARPTELLVAALVALVAALPFLDKAVQQDDWAYLAIAPHVLADPGDWLEEETLYRGAPIPAAQGILHGPVWLTLLAVGLRVGDGGLVVPHLLMAAFLALLAAATASLAARLGARPLPVAVALALAPGPLVMAGSVMTDLPMVALFAWALALALRGVQGGSRPALVGAGVVGLAAALTRYHGLAVLPLFAVLPLLVRGPGRSRWGAWLPLATATAGFGAFAAWTVAATGQADFERARGMLLEIEAIDRTACLLAAVCALGGCGIGWAVGALASPVRTVRGALAGGAKPALVAAGAALALALAWLAARRPGPAPEGVNAVLQALALAGGALGLAAALRPWAVLLLDRAGRSAWRERHGAEAWVGLWLLGFAFAAWTTVPFGATRYALPALPPFFLLAGRFAGRRLPAHASWIAAAVCAVAGLASAVADERAADVYRRYARRVAAEEEAADEPRELWVWGELGFRWYLEHEAGARVLPRDSNAPAPGARIHKSSLCTPTPDDGRSGYYPIDPLLYRRLTSERVELAEDAWPVRVHNAQARAGFYNADAGFLPFALSRAPHDALQTWRVGEQNAFFARFEAARVETDAERQRRGGNVQVERFRVHPELGMRMAVSIFRPGSVTWDGVEVPADGVLEVAVGESWRVWAEGAPGRGARVRIRVDGEVALEHALDARGEPADRRWIPLELDLAPWAGRSVSIGFESLPRPDPDAATGGPEPIVFTAFAEPRVVRRP